MRIATDKNDDITFEWQSYVITADKHNGISIDFDENYVYHD